MYGILMLTNLGYTDGKCYHIWHTYGSHGSYGYCEIDFNHVPLVSPEIPQVFSQFPRFPGHQTPTRCPHHSALIQQSAHFGAEFLEQHGGKDSILLVSYVMDCNGGISVKRCL